MVEVTDGTTDYNATRYRISVYYDLAKVSGEPPGLLAGTRACAASAAPRSRSRPGWLRSEMMLEAFGVTEDNWRDVHRPARLRAVGVTPLRRPRRRRAGRRPRPRPVEPAVGHSGQLAEAYGFTDVDGTQPEVWRYIADSRATDTAPDPDEYR